MSPVFAAYRRQLGRAFYLDELGNGVCPGAVGGITWISLNSLVFSPLNQYEGRGEQARRTLQWLRQQLAAQPPGRTVVIASHIPPTWDLFGHNPAWEPADLQRLGEILEAYPGCALIVSGHFHRNELHAFTLKQGRAVPVLDAGAPRASTAIARTGAVITGPWTPGPCPRPWPGATAIWPTVHGTASGGSSNRSWRAPGLVGSSAWPASRSSSCATWRTSGLNPTPGVPTPAQAGEPAGRPGRVPGATWPGGGRGPLILPGYFPSRQRRSRSRMATRWVRNSLAGGYSLLPAARPYRPSKRRAFCS